MTEEYVYCRRCNRRLKSDKAKENGVGPVCGRKEQIAIEAGKDQFVMEMGTVDEERGAIPAGA